ncbi:hypothetical protein ACFVMC_10525 [Nocardia sp. NPDC127579]|uniref:hypothetical protein n=1 Tax=Nocardia sp. NPDC127579 TaxID=3345402 RepID=UPI0036262648
MWGYDAQNPRTGANTYPDTGTNRTTPHTGIVALTSNYGNRLTAHTDDGCEWSMVARGTTAKLDPPIQTCTLGDAAVTLRYWTIATDGQGRHPC